MPSTDTDLSYQAWNIRNALAATLEANAQWRERKAEEYPEDDRNAKWAERLHRVADYVVKLSEDDARLVDMARAEIRHGEAAWCDIPEAGLLLEDDGLRSMTARIDHDDASRWLDDFAAEYVRDLDRRAGVEATDDAVDPPHADLLRRGLAVLTEADAIVEEIEAMRDAFYEANPDGVEPADLQVLNELACGIDCRAGSPESAADARQVARHVAEEALAR